MKGGVEDLRVLRRIPKIRLLVFLTRRVGEHFKNTEAIFVRSSGVLRRENVGMSNRNLDEKSRRRKPKVSLAM